MTPSDVVIIVQARLGSQRFPQKVLAPLHGQPMLLYQLWRIVSQGGLGPDGEGRLVVACANTPEDHEVLVPLLRRHGYDVQVPAVDPNNVLGRYQAVVTQMQATWIVRLTGDCPLFDPTLLWGLIQVVQTMTPAYAALGADWPDGLDIEVIHRDALLAAHDEATDPADREHVTPYIWRRPERFLQLHMPCPYALGDERWSVDTPGDLDFIRAVVRTMHRRYGMQRYGWQEVWALVQEIAWRPHGHRNGAYLAQIGSTRSWEAERYGTTKEVT